MPGVVEAFSPGAAGGALGGHGDITPGPVGGRDVLEDGAVHLGRHLVAVAHELHRHLAEFRPGEGALRRKGGAAGTVDDTQEPQGLSGPATSGSAMSVKAVETVDAVSAAVGRTSIPHRTAQVSSSDKTRFVLISFLSLQCGVAPLFRPQGHHGLKAAGLDGGVHAEDDAQRHGNGPQRPR